MECNSIILASASPRRQELLKTVVEDFEVLVSNVDEIVPPEISALEVPQFLATIKAKDVAKNNPDRIVIGADTCVFNGDKILGKPSDREDAYNMLQSLSGKTHSVITGCALIKGNKSISFSVKTDVEFFDLTESEIEDYLNTNEPFDKAGSYGIQGKGALFVKRINGDYFNVVGLPISKLSRVLKTFYELTK